MLPGGASPVLLPRSRASHLPLAPQHRLLGRHVPRLPGLLLPCGVSGTPSGPWGPGHGLQRLPLGRVGGQEGQSHTDLIWDAVHCGFTFSGKGPQTRLPITTSRPPTLCDVSSWRGRGVGHLHPDPITQQSSGQTLKGLF